MKECKNEENGETIGRNRIHSWVLFAQCGVLSPSAHSRARRRRPCVHVAVMPFNTAQELKRLPTVQRTLHPLGLGDESG